MVQLATFFYSSTFISILVILFKSFTNRQTDRQTEPKKHGLRINGQLSEILKSLLESFF